MKRIGTAIAAIVFAGSASAYEGTCFERNNPDLYSGYSATITKTAVQPGVGDKASRVETRSSGSATSYDMWIGGNPDQES